MAIFVTGEACERFQKLCAMMNEAPVKIDKYQIFRLETSWLLELTSSADFRLE